MFKYAFDDLFNPLLKALHNLGGSSTIEELENEVAKIMNLNDEDLSEIHEGSRTKFSYRLAWARTYLKRAGIINNSERGVWSLTEEGIKTKIVNKNDIKDRVKNLFREIPTRDTKIEFMEPEREIGVEETSEMGWQEEMLKVLQEIPPDKF
jgi:restriction system protein